MKHLAILSSIPQPKYQQHRIQRLASNFNTFGVQFARSYFAYHFNKGYHLTLI